MLQTIKINGVTYDVKEMKAPLASDSTKNAVFVETSDATATASDIRDGKTAYIKGELVDGSMPQFDGVNAQSKSITPTKSQQVIQPDSGYTHLEQVTVAAIPATYITTSDANAADDDIKSGKTAYVNGKKVTGTHTDPAFTLANGVLSIV